MQDQSHQTYNINTHFIAPNPVTSINPKSVSPKIAPTAYIGPFSCIIGDVTIADNVIIAPHVSIRADEGSPFYIDSDTNLQDGVILHGLAHGKVIHDNKEYSIYIGKNVSCAHGSIIHGPSKIGSGVFVGFYAIVHNAVIGDNCFIGHKALVTGGITLAPNRLVPAGAIIDTQEAADKLGEVPQSLKEFAEEVIDVNKEFPKSYFSIFGETKCSSGFTAGLQK